MAIEGSTTKEVFEAYVEHLLAPTLTTGQVVVMDNLSAHKGERVRELIEVRGCELLHLPPYSPDLNPIEEAFSRIKRFLRQIKARTRGALVRQQAKHSMRSMPRMRVVSSLTAVTACEQSRPACPKL